MLSQEVKFAVKKLWNLIKDEGSVRDSLSVAEHIFYLFYLYTDRYSVSYEYGNNLSYPIHSENLSKTLNNSLTSRQPENSFYTNVSFDLNDTEVIDKCFYIIKELLGEIEKQHYAFLGEIAEYILDIAFKDNHGPYIRTPSHIIKLMCSLLNLGENGNMIADISCGVGDFLIESRRYLYNSSAVEDDDEYYYRDNSDSNWPPHFRFHLEGFEENQSIIRLGWMNLFMHGQDDIRLYNKGVDKMVFHSFDYIISNPSLDKKTRIGNHFEESRFGHNIRGDVYYLEKTIDLLKPNGKAAIIVPESLLFSEMALYKNVREFILGQCIIEAIISLPNSVFRPQAAVKTSIILLRKLSNDRSSVWSSRELHPVWFYNLENDGFNKQGRRLNENPLIKLYNSFKDRYSSGSPDNCSFLVEQERIRENNYKLSFSDYKDYEPIETVHHSAQELIHQIEELEQKIRSGMSDLANLISRYYD